MSESANSFQLDRPLVGFRTWYTRPLVPPSIFRPEYMTAAYKPKPLSLYPMTTDVPWAQGINTASCIPERRATTFKDRHESPHAECYCGLHAYVNPEHDLESQWITHLFDKDLLVQGAVLMWGVIFGGKKVIRSQFAEIVAILSDTNIAKLVAEKYHVPCVSKEHMIYLATEHGDQVSPELEEAIEARTKAATDPPKDFPKSA